MGPPDRGRAVQVVVPVSAIPRRGPGSSRPRSAPYSLRGPAPDNSRALPLTPRPPRPILQLPDAGWSSLVARRAHNPKVAGSNPAPATTWPRERKLPGPDLFRAPPPAHPAPRTPRERPAPTPARDGRWAAPPLLVHVGGHVRDPLRQLRAALSGHRAHAGSRSHPDRGRLDRRPLRGGRRARRAARRHHGRQGRSARDAPARAVRRRRGHDRARVRVRHARIRAAAVLGRAAHRDVPARHAGRGRRPGATAGSRARVRPWPPRPSARPPPTTTPSRRGWPARATPARTSPTASPWAS